MSVGSDTATISLEAKKSDDGSAQFFWRNVHGNVEYHNSLFNPVRSIKFPRLCLPTVNLCFLCHTRMFKTLYLRTNAFLLGVIVCEGPDKC